MEFHKRNPPWGGEKTFWTDLCFLVVQLCAVSSCVAIVDIDLLGGDCVVDSPCR